MNPNNSLYHHIIYLHVFSYYTVSSSTAAELCIILGASLSSNGPSINLVWRNMFFMQVTENRQSWLVDKKKYQWINQPWLVWLSGLSAGLQTERSLVRFPVRVHAWVEGQVPSLGVCKRQPMDVSLPLFVLPFPSLEKWVNKNLFKKSCALP